MFFTYLVFQDGRTKEIAVTYHIEDARDKAAPVPRVREHLKRIEIRDTSKLLEVLWDADWTQVQLESRAAFDAALLAIREANGVLQQLAKMMGDPSALERTHTLNRLLRHRTELLTTEALQLRERACTR